MKTILILAALLVLSEIGLAQPPTAPPPREIKAEIRNLTWMYSGPEVGAKTPVVVFEATEGRVEVRWKTDRSSHVATATRAAIRDGVLLLAGTEEEPVLVRETRTTDKVVETLSGLRIDVSLSAGTYTVKGATKRK